MRVQEDPQLNLDWILGPDSGRRSPCEMQRAGPLQESLPLRLIEPDQRRPGLCDVFWEVDLAALQAIVLHEIARRELVRR